MLSRNKKKPKSVAEKVAELITHPNESGSGSESENEATSARVIEFDEDEYQLPQAGVTEFRKRNVKLLSEQSAKYKGKIASRREMEEESDEDEMAYEESDEEEQLANGEEDSDSEDEAFKSFKEVMKSKKNASLAEEDIDDDEEEEENEEEQDEAFHSLQKVKTKKKTSFAEENNTDDEEEQDDIAESDMNSESADENGDMNDSEDDEDDDQSNDEDEDDFEDEDDEEDESQVMSKVNHEAEIQKGICVQNQLRLWERLLDMRINSQKILSKANAIPEPKDLQELASGQNNKSIIEETTKNVQGLLQNLLSLQDTLYSQYSEVQNTMKPAVKRAYPFKDQSTSGPPSKQLNTYLQERFDTFRPYRNAVLLKWDDRTKLLTPGAGMKKKSMNEEYDIIKKIDSALLNKSALIKKSQQAKAKQDSDAENQEPPAGNSNVYDDTDFYHQQLRELIEYKANTSNSMSEVTKQFLELQKLRQKMKKKVDTRASKGRKLRYIVHNKLINFMAPQDNCSWTEESINELSKSLFV